MSPAILTGGREPVEIDDRKLAEYDFKTDANYLVNRAKWATKMSKAQAAIEAIAKNGFNEFHKFAYVSIEDVFGEVRRALTANQIFILGTVVGLQREAGLNKKNEEVFWFKIEIEYEVFDTETGFSVKSTWFGESLGNDDKSINKANSSNLKYFLMNLFMIEREDPDGTSGDGATSKPAAPRQKSNAPQAPRREVDPETGEVKENKITVGGVDLNAPSQSQWKKEASEPQRNIINGGIKALSMPVEAQKLVYERIQKAIADAGFENKPVKEWTQGHASVAIQIIKGKLMNFDDLRPQEE